MNTLCIDGRGFLLTFTGLQRYYEYLASRKNAAPTKEKRKEEEDFDCSGKKVPFGPSDSGSSRQKKKKGKGLLRLIEAYSKHVEGLQMIQ